MAAVPQPSTSPTDNRSPTDDRKQSPPAFLDLADSVRRYMLLYARCNADLIQPQAARLGTNMPDISAVRDTLLARLKRALCALALTHLSYIAR